MTTPPGGSSSGGQGGWDPFREFEELYDRLGRWVETVGGHGTPRAWLPAADVLETEDAFLVELELPGVRRDDIDIEVDGSVLTVRGELKVTEREGWFRHRTRRTGQFYYQVTLPNGVDPERIDAGLDDGVLTVRVPKSDAARPRRIPVSGR
ncbi:MAG TPA: Hsp20/alpha crystallin family protein [Pseudonocardiaceae bacterium]